MRRRTDETPKQQPKVDNEQAPTSAAVAAPSPPTATQPPRPLEREQERPPQGRNGDAAPLASIVEFLFTVDVAAEFDSVKGKLQLPLPPSQCEYGVIVDALDRASEAARLTMQLHVVARSVVADIATTKAQLDAPLYQAAMAKCAANRDAGKSGSKTITNEDVKNMAYAMFPDDIGRRDDEHNKAKRAVEYLEGLVGCWNERVKSLRQMVATART